jgi:hypothetical protein
MRRNGTLTLSVPAMPAANIYLFYPTTAISVPDTELINATAALFGRSRGRSGIRLPRAWTAGAATTR